MTRITRRRVVWAAIGLLVLAAGVYVLRVASILTAYKAKMLCSEVLLAQRDARAVLTELEVDDLAPLRYISASVDPSAQATTASFVGLVSHHASYRDDHGCALQPGPPTAGVASRTEAHHTPRDTLIDSTNHALDPVLARALKGL